MILHNLLSLDTSNGVPYLFHANSTVVEFVVIEEEMEELNELCYRCDQAAIGKIGEANQTEFLSHSEAEIDESFSSWLQDMDSLRWNKVQEVVVAGMILVLLFTFLEKSLKWLCTRIGPEDFDIRKLKHSGSTLDAYISQLQTQCGLLFTEPDEFQKVRTHVRPLRNSFVHGDWSDFSESIGDIDLSKVFGAVSGLIAEIENAYLRKLKL